MNGSESGAGIRVGTEGGRETGNGNSTKRKKVARGINVRERRRDQIVGVVRDPRKNI